jgi:hypothetical protein
MFKKTATIVMLAVSLTAGSGCNSAWWQNFKNNPVEQVQAFEQSVQVVLNVAEATWAIVYPLLPANVQPQALADYNKAVITANAAINTLNDAVQVAVAAQGTPPDFTALEQAISDAVQQIITVINTYKGQTNATLKLAASAPDPFVALNASFTTMKKVGGLK